MSISFEPFRRYMEEHGVSYYYLGNEGIDAQTLQRLRHDKPVTTDTIGKLCRILQCQPGELIAYRFEQNENEDD